MFLFTVPDDPAPMPLPSYQQSRHDPVQMDWDGRQSFPAAGAAGLAVKSNCRCRSESRECRDASETMAQCYTFAATISRHSAHGGVPKLLRHLYRFANIYGKPRKSMKTKTTFIAAIATVVILVGCSERDMKRELLSISAKRENDPATMMLGDAYNSYVKQTFLIDANVETGIITMANGETAKY